MVVHSASFNQDASCVAIGSNKGYRIYSCNPFGQFYKTGSAAIGEVEMLFTTSLVVVVGHGDDPAFSPRRVKVVNTKRDLTLCELTFPTAVLRVLMNRQRLVIVLERQLFLYNIATMKLLHTIDTIPNPHGVADLTPGTDAGVLVYPSGSRRADPSEGSNAGGSSSTTPQHAGEVTVFDCSTLSPLNIIKAHKSPLAILALNGDGSLLATASDKGTILRVLSVPAGTLLHEFRRGSYSSSVYSISFNLSSNILAVTSSTQTVHIYKMSALSEALQAKSSAAESGAGTFGDSTAPDTSLHSDVHGSGDDDDDDELGGGDVTDAPGADPSRANSGSLRSREQHDSDDSIALDTIVETKRKGYKASFKRKMSRARGLLPNAVTDIWEPKTRDFAWFKLPSAPGTHNVVALAPLSRLVLVASADGSLYHYALAETGGECKRIAEYSLEA